MRSKARLEICVDTPTSFATAVSAGADRIELCADLAVGGLTPAPGLIAAARDAPVPVYAMIRPRVGDFVYDTLEVAAMVGDIAAVKQAGLAGVVIGASRADRSLDTDTLTVLLRAAAGLGTTLHRAFDLVPNRSAALHLAIDLGFERVLTSGGLTDAHAGRGNLRALVQGAAGRIGIMAGGGVTPSNVAAIMQETGATEMHASAKSAVSSDADLVRWGFSPPQIFSADAAIIRALRAAMETVTPAGEARDR